MDNAGFESPKDRGTDATPGGDGGTYTAVDVEGAPHAEKTAPLVADAPYAGMGKDDLLRFSQTPFWSRLRMACLIGFWLAWLGLLVAVVVLTIVMPRCTAPPANTWSQQSVIYDVFVPSYYDASGDGVGDIQGVIEKLDYIRGLEVNAVALSSFYVSGNDAFSDVTDHKDVDPRLGKLDDVTALVKAAHEKGLKVLLDFIPNYTSKNHAWFAGSESSGNHTTNSYWNYYVWASCPGGASKPNNWVSVYGGSAWEYSATRDECYFHNFLTEEPELNLRSTSVQEELAAILRFWVTAADVDGFRIRSASFLFEDSDLRDDEVVVGCTDLSSYDCLTHTRTRHQEENYVIVKQWRKVLDELSGDRILVVESSDGINATAAFYGGTALDGANLPINIQLSTLQAKDDAIAVRELVSDWLRVTPAGGTANWASASSEIGRQDRQPNSALHMLKLTLPGTALTYYGEELGMRNGNHSGTPEDPAGKIDISFSRDPYRTPMQWSSAVNAGFTNASAGPWIPVNDDASDVNVQTLEDQSDSSLILFRSLALLRAQEGALQYGDFSFALTSENVISYTRQFNGLDSFLVALNFGQVDTVNDVTSANSTIPSDAEVVLTTSAGVAAKVGDTTSLKSLSLRPGEGVLVKWPYKR